MVTQGAPIGKQLGVQFVPLPYKALDDERLGVYDVSVYAALLSYANERHIAYPSIKTLERRARCKQTTVSKSLNVLERLGYIRRIKVDGRSTNVYEVFYGPSESKNADDIASDTNGIASKTNPIVYDAMDHSVKNYGGKRKTLYPIASDTNKLDTVSRFTELDTLTGDDIADDGWTKDVPAQKHRGFDPTDDSWERDMRFKQLVSVYPRRQDLAHAYPAFRRALTKTNLPTLIAAASNYAASVTDPRYVRSLKNWLEGCGWLDEQTKTQEQVRDDGERSEAIRIAKLNLDFYMGYGDSREQALKQFDHPKWVEEYI